MARVARGARLARGGAATACAVAALVAIAGSGPAAALAWPETDGVEVCGMVAVPTRAPGGLAVRELSGLAGNRERLYAVSDEGVIATLAPRFSAGGRLVDVVIERAVELRDVDGTRLPPGQRDAEGLGLVITSISAEGAEPGVDLWISFESEPRIERFGLDGRRRGGILLSEPVSSDSFSSPSKAFEALAVVAGGPLTAPEAPSSGSTRSVPLLGAEGEVARFPLSEAHESSLVGLDVVRGRTLVALERSYHASEGRTVITLSSFDLPTQRGRTVEKRTWLVLDSLAGHAGIDNFEGVVALEGGRVLLVSDDNTSALQRPLLLCLDVQGLREEAPAMDGQGVGRR